MRILFVGNYPNAVDENLYIFYKNLIHAIADLGVECCVVSPVSITKYKNKVRNIPSKVIENTANGNKVMVFHPKYISYSSKKILSFNTIRLTHFAFKRACYKCIMSLDKDFDAIYGHFFVSAGLTASYIGKKLNIPAFVAYGESSFDTQVVQKYGMPNQKEIQGFKGIISLCQKNTFELKNAKIFDHIPIVTYPNAVDMNLFGEHNKIEMREKYNIPNDKFVVGFVGSFIERKGHNRLLKACEFMNDVGLAFAGKGEAAPQGKNVVFCQSVNHDNIGEFLACLDVFCLPTLNEGCCNAIIEAMAAGLPIVSSDLPFNDGVLSTDNSIRIDPMNISQIRAAIENLKNDDVLRQKLASTAKSDSREFSIVKRAEKILNFIRNPNN